MNTLFKTTVKVQVESFDLFGDADLEECAEFLEDTDLRILVQNRVNELAAFFLGRGKPELARELLSARVTEE